MAANSNQYLKQRKILSPSRTFLLLGKWKDPCNGAGSLCPTLKFLRDSRYSFRVSSKPRSEGHGLRGHVVDPFERGAYLSQARRSRICETDRNEFTCAKDFDWQASGGAFARVGLVYMAFARWAVAVFDWRLIEDINICICINDRGSFMYYFVPRLSQTVFK